MANNKKVSQKIIDWMKGVDSDMPVIKSPLSEMGGNASTPKGNALHTDAAAHDAEALRIRSGTKRKYNDGTDAGEYDFETGKRVYSAEEKRAWQAGVNARTEGRAADKAHADKMKRGADRAPDHGDLLRRSRDESRAFYDSDAGKNTSDYVPKNGDLAKNPDKKKGSGFGVKIDDGSKTMSPKQMSDFISQHAAGNYGAKLDDFNNGLRVNKPSKPQSMSEETPAQKSHHTKMAEGGFAHRIGKDAPNREKYIEMGKQSDIKDYYKRQNIQDNIKTNPSSGLTEREKGIITGATAAGTGAAAANAYWTRKKEQDRGGNK